MVLRLRRDDACFLVAKCMMYTSGHFVVGRFMAHMHGVLFVHISATDKVLTQTGQFCFVSVLSDTTEVYLITLMLCAS